MNMMRFFDDDRTKEILDIIRPFCGENGVGIFIYQSQSASKVFEYDLVGFEGSVLYMKYIFKRDTTQRPTRYIHSIRDALLAVTNAKMHSMCHDFEVDIVFDKDTDEFAGIQFYKNVEGMTKDYRPKFHFTSNPCVVELVRVIKQFDNGGKFGIAIFPTDLKEERYYVTPFDYVIGEGGKVSKVTRKDQAIVLKEAHEFDDIVCAVTNAKAYESCRDFEIGYFENAANGLSCLSFSRI